MVIYCKYSKGQHLFFKVYVYESTNLDRLLTYSPYSNKFENPLLI